MVCGYGYAHIVVPKGKRKLPAAPKLVVLPAFHIAVHGHSWKKLSENILYVKNRKIDNLILNVNHVIQTPSYHSIIEMVEFFDNLQLPIHPILLTSPSHFHISSLTKKSKMKFLEDTEKYLGFNIEFINFVRSVSKEHIEQDVRLTHECISHLSEFDKVRGNSYKNIIPVGNIGTI